MRHEPRAGRRASSPHLLYCRFEGELLASSNDNLGGDGVLLEQLAESASEIESEISKQISARLKRLLSHEFPVEADICFFTGSVGFAGAVIVVLDWAARLSGAAAFVELIVDTTRLVLRRVLQRHARSHRVSVTVTASTPVVPEVAATGAAGGTNSPFTLRSILLAVTLLNAALFLGGTIYTGISLNSIRERYEEAEKIIDQVEDTYQTRLASSVAELEKGVDRALKRRKYLEKKTQKFSDEVDRASQLRESAVAQASGWITFRTAWRQANWGLRILMGLVLLTSAGVFFLIAVWLSQR